MYNLPILEQQLQYILQTELGGLTEKETPVRRIDLLTDTELIEIKEATQWKSAIGQLVSYHCYYPKHKLVLYLFGYLSDKLLVEVQKITKDRKIELRLIAPRIVLENVVSLENEIKYFALKTNAVKYRRKTLKQNKSFKDPAVERKLNQDKTYYAKRFEILELNKDKKPLTLQS